MLVVGFGDDEAYTLVVARQWSLSYFDHPPLHQWLLHGFVALFGEGHIDRLPFWALLVATNLPLYGLTNRLFGREAALWALFAFNASAYFLILPDGFILPDAALLPLLATAMWAIAEAAPPRRDGDVQLAAIAKNSNCADRAETHAWPLWLVAGAAIGLAGLSKYLAVFAPLGLLGFFLFSPAHRRWFARPEPHAAAALALALLTPALLWNARNGWVSFAFQTTRSQGGWSFGAHAWNNVLQTVLEQAGSLTPWVFVPALLAIFAAMRADRSSGARLMLWLALPTLLVFALLPLSGKRPIPHWFNSGWLFVYPLVGVWLAARTPRRVARWASASAALSALLVAIYLPLVTLGPSRALPFLGPLAHDPTAASYDWPGLSWSRSWNAGGAPDFVVVDHWRTAGRVGVALGPNVPICLFGSDPRGLAFACDSKTFLGGDALIVISEGDAQTRITALAPYFASVGTAETFTIGRSGAAERALTLARAHALSKPYPLPYGPER